MGHVHQSQRTVPIGVAQSAAGAFLPAFRLARRPPAAAAVWRQDAMDTLRTRLPYYSSDFYSTRSRMEGNDSSCPYEFHALRRWVWDQTSHIDSRSMTGSREGSVFACPGVTSVR